MDDSTYLEEFLSSIEGMPNDVRRDFELMRDLDRETLEMNRELVELEEKYVARANARAESRQPTVLQFNGKLKESADETTPKVGDVYTDAQDPEGGVMLSEINAVRAKISSRLTEKTGEQPSFPSLSPAYRTSLTFFFSPTPHA
jgi:Inhibitor of growth proteins N-terminal histone-binding